MYTQGEKLKGKESRAATHTSIQKKSDVKQSVGFVDNRPKAARQRKLQAQADHHSVQKQQAVPQGASPLQLTTTHPSEDILQLVALSKDKLNVVGEDHMESGGERRVVEKPFCEEKTKGRYWTEEAFTISANQAETSADPHSYRFLTVLHTIARMSSYFTEQDKSYMNTVTLSSAFRLSIMLGPMIALAEKHWAAAEGVPYPGPLTDEQLAIRDNLLRARFNELQRLKASLNELKKLNGKRLNQEKRQSIKLHYDTIAEARKSMVERLMLKSDLDLLRSQKMHDSAQQKSGTVGVWKIGQDHVTDIEKNLPDVTAPTYHLLKQDQFNTILDEDPLFRYMAENPTPAEAKERGLFGKKR